MKQAERWLAKKSRKKHSSSDSVETPTILKQNKTVADTDSHKIAIIGGGPKGMYGFERLAANFKACPPDRKIEIHVYNQSDSFGAGNIYNTTQPPYLLINNPVGDINMWPDDEPAPVIENPMSLTQWMRSNGYENISEFDYTSRAIVGCYLSEGFKNIMRNLPDDVSAECIIGDVTDLFENEGKYALKLRMNEGETQQAAHKYDDILLATGHSQNRPTVEDFRLKRFEETFRDFIFIPFVYPVRTALSTVAPGSSVAVKGIGLTFVDAVLALTEGRGGTFQRNEATGVLQYSPCGSEPRVIYPFSRSGLPMIPRRVMAGPSSGLRFFTQMASEQRKGGGKLDFEKQVLPLLKQEMMYAYYEVEMRNSGFIIELSTCGNYDEVEEAIEAYHNENPAKARFSPDDYWAPASHSKLHDAGSFHQFVRSYLGFHLAEAGKGEHNSPWAAVSAVWRKATPLFGDLYAFGGLTPGSQRNFDQNFRGLLNRVTFGPPAESTEKITALMDSGILNFELAEHPEINPDEDSRGVFLASKQKTIRRKIYYLIDARISKVSLFDEQSPLYRNLLNRGMISIFENKSGKDAYKPGCIAISRDGFVIDSKGLVNRDIAVTGTPTEGITFDNDTLSRKRNNFVIKWANYVSKKYVRSTVGQ